MPYFPQPPPYRTADENLMASLRVSEIDRANREAEDGDEMRDEPASTGSGRWLVILLGFLGIAGLFILLYFFASVL